LQVPLFFTQQFSGKDKT